MVIEVTPALIVAIALLFVRNVVLMFRPLAIVLLLLFVLVPSFLVVELFSFSFVPTALLVPSLGVSYVGMKHRAGARVCAFR